MTRARRPSKREQERAKHDERLKSVDHQRALKRASFEPFVRSCGITPYGIELRFQSMPPWLAEKVLDAFDSLRPGGVGTRAARDEEMGAEPTYTVAS